MTTFIGRVADWLSKNSSNIKWQYTTSNSAPHFIRFYGNSNYIMYMAMSGSDICLEVADDNGIIKRINTTDLDDLSKEIRLYI